MKLKLLDNKFAVCRMDDTAVLPLWAVAGNPFVVSRIEGELSVICGEEYVPDGILCRKNYRIIKIDEKLEFSMIGVMAKISDVLAGAEISILAVSTYDTDYILISDDKVHKAVKFLNKAGYEFV